MRSILRNSFPSGSSKRTLGHSCVSCVRRRRIQTDQGVFIPLVNWRTTRLGSVMPLVVHWSLQLCRTICSNCASCIRLSRRSIPGFRSRMTIDDSVMYATVALKTLLPFAYVRKLDNNYVGCLCLSTRIDFESASRCLCDLSTIQTASNRSARVQQNHSHCSSANHFQSFQSFWIDFKSHCN